MDGIAIIGMAGKFPGAKNVDAFWQNLAAGVESLTRFTDDELEMRPPPEAGNAFVPVRGILEDAAMFDAALFNIRAREAEVMDPQQRVFLECAWEALENAGYDPDRFPGLIGVWAGASFPPTFCIISARTARSSKASRETTSTAGRPSSWATT